MSRKNSKTVAVEPLSVEIKNYPASLIREYKSKFDNATFRVLSFPYNGLWASCYINESEMRPSKRLNGEPYPNRLDLMLGESDDVRRCTIKDLATNTFSPILMFNSTIEAAIKASRKAYLQSLAV